MVFISLLTLPTIYFRNATFRLKQREREKEENKWRSECPQQSQWNCSTLPSEKNWLNDVFSPSCTHGVKPTLWETQLATSQRSVSVLSPPCSVVPRFRKKGTKLYLKGTKLVTVVVSCLVYVHCTFSQRYTIVPLQFDPLESQLCHATLYLTVIS